MAEASIAYPSTTLAATAPPAITPLAAGAAPRRRLPLSAALMIGFGLPILLGLGGALALALVAGFENTRSLVWDKADLMIGRLEQEIQRLMDPAAELVRFLATQGHETDPAALEAALRGALAAVPQINSTIYIEPSFRVTMVLRENDDPDGSGPPVVMREDWTGRYELDTLFARLSTATGPTWGNPVFVAGTDEDDAPGTFLYTQMPVRDGLGRVTGAYLASLEIGMVSRALDQYLRDSRFDLTPFVLVGTDKVAAHPRFAALQPWLTDAHRLPGLALLDDPVLRAAYIDGHTETLVTGAPPGLEGRLVTVDPSGDFADEDDIHILLSRQIAGFGTGPWTVGVHIREPDIGAEYDRLSEVAALSAGMFLLVLGFAFWMARMVAVPIRRLETAARQLGTDGPAATAPVPPSRIRETDTAARAFNAMTEGLRDREQMREAFGRYVPEAIVPAILADRGVLNPTTREATVLFTDIQGFSTISEQLQPEHLIALLNDYFEVAIAPIEANGGVIHQFQGDAILATFNLPVDDPDHAGRAVQTALALQEALTGRLFDPHTGGPDVALVTRIGINSGIITGGTVGAGGRLGYTVHGDAVNVAARLEQLNKVHGTRVLVSETTVALCRDRFDFTPMGTLPIRGRTAGARVFRVAGPQTPFETPH